ncbi:MAG: PVC-type heme-binding CxxCH protein [Verrucomicrobiota bacterium]|nr:PVC-type heme-binding CxxCH protein [Verrucomicrobiota bacterium]
MRFININFFLLPIMASGLAQVAIAHTLEAKIDRNNGTITIHRDGMDEPLVTQNAAANHRPYLHPIVGPDGKGIFTEYSPGHHKHQTGIYWGFTRVNGRDYFHHPEKEYWKRKSVEVLEAKGESVKWETIYDLLDADGNAVLTETQRWEMRSENDRHVLNLEWQGTGQTDVSIGKYSYGGLFVRMPWKKGIKGEAVNAARDVNRRAEGKRAMWLDVGMEINGRDDWGHIAIFDHPKNQGYPQPWRVDGQLGVGPVRARLGDWKIAKGKTETIRHQIQVYGGKLNDKELTNRWKAYTGQRGTYALWQLAKRAGREAKFLSPQEAVENSTIEDGFTVNSWANEPMITQPMAFCWDDKGRMWVAENRDYETRGRGFSASGDSRILILEDTDRDGVADKRSVFLEGIPFPSAVAVGLDGLWLGAPPNLLFVPDRNKDDKADVDDIEVRLTGWGIRDRHEVLNSLHWGPDGWIYGCQGVFTPSIVGKPKGAGKIFKHGEPYPTSVEFDGEGQKINGGVWRYHPTKDVFEIVAHGFSNPWGIDYDAKGQLFISACVIPHLWHVIPGGAYHRQAGRHFNPYVYSDIRTIADHRHRSAHGGARVYMSDAYPKEYQGKIFMANIHEHAVLTDELVPTGSGYVGKHHKDFMHANNEQWIGFSMEIGPAGNVYVLDWHDGDICGNAVLQKHTGRIFRLAPKDSLAQDWKGRYDDVEKLSDAKLVEYQSSASSWHARRARVVLQGRAINDKLAKDTQRLLKQMFRKNKNPDHRLRALWSLHVIGGIKESDHINNLSDNDEHIRAWTIQFLCEDKNPSSKVLKKFAIMAHKDASPVVRLYLASAMQRLSLDKRWDIAAGLVIRAEDANDHNLPKLIWYGIEPLVPENPTRAMKLAQASRLPLVTEYIARRAVDARQLEELSQVLGQLEREETIVHMLRGFSAGLKGLRDVKAPTSWGATYAKLQNQPIATQIAQILGDEGAVTAMLATLDNSRSKLSERQTALRGLASQEHTELKSRLLPLLDDESLRIESIRAMASYDDKSFSRELLNRYSKLNDDGKLAVIQTLASRPSYAKRLTDAIESGGVPRRDMPAYIVRQMRRVAGPSFVDVWGNIDSLSADKETAFAKYRGLLTSDATSKGSAIKGRTIYERTCSACHKLYGKGGEIGPDLTGSNRANLDYILENILNPSGDIPEGYQMLLVTTRGGQTYAGTLASENEQQLVLRVVGLPPVTLAKSEIQSREKIPTSMMPEGLLAGLKDTEIIDLIVYLRTTKNPADK